ncbi:hypothetical protein ACJIZ3_003475 [Penstemon smallii]|uniref:Enoyl reductase (ER) domain-containing protein n=1 Tax=Penstemon smallii TaxID=265156 RepID=A0ABD3UAM5_9LAMI
METFARMNAAFFKKSWFSSTLKLKEINTPEIKDDEVLLTICGIGVNNNDLVKGSDVCPGIECSGVISVVGRNVQDWKIGERVCALVDGGAYAEQVAVPVKFLLRVPDSIPLEDAACLPSIACNIWLALFTKEDRMMLKEETILIREGASGLGVLAIQFAKYKGMKVIATAGTDQELEDCQKYGADVCITTQVMTLLSVSFVLDYGTRHLNENLLCCDLLGKVAIINLHGYEKTSIMFGVMNIMHLEYYEVDIRSESMDEKALVIDEARTNLWPVVEKLEFIIEDKYPLRDAQRAHEALKKSNNLGNIILFNMQNEMSDECSRRRKRV